MWPVLVRPSHCSHDNRHRVPAPHWGLHLSWLNRKSEQGKPTEELLGGPLRPLGDIFPAANSRESATGTVPPSAEPTLSKLFRQPLPFKPGSGQQRKQLVMLEQTWPPRRLSPLRAPTVLGWSRASGCFRCWGCCSCWPSPAWAASTTWRSR